MAFPPPTYLRRAPGVFSSFRWSREVAMEGAKRKKRGEADGVKRALEKAGDAFMRMFDDAPTAAPKSRGKAVAAAAEAARAEEEARLRKAHKGKKRARGDAGVVADAPGDAGASAKGPARASAAAPSDVQVVVFGGDRPNLAASRAPTSASGTSPGLSRAAKRLFMSDKVSKVHEVAAPVDPELADKRGASGASTRTADGQPMGEVVGLTGASLNDMRKQVENFSARGLDKWSKKALEQRRRVELGAKAEKGIRIPATIGVGLWKKNEEREEKKRIKEFEMGGRLMKKKRGLRKADTLEGKPERERGLAWGSGNFKGGILTLRKSDVAASDSKAQLASRVYLSGTKLSGSDRPKGKQAGKKGGKKGGRPQGGKKGKRR